MAYVTDSATLEVAGQRLSLDMRSDDALTRAVLISLFTWRRARPDDRLPDDRRHGWWGDTYATVNGDRIGSRLWLLTREKLTQETINRAREYAEEALAWMRADGVAARISVQVDRRGLDRLDLLVRIWRREGDRQPVELRFDNFWQEMLNA